MLWDALGGKKLLFTDDYDGDLNRGAVLHNTGKVDFCGLLGRCVWQKGWVSLCAKADSAQGGQHLGPRSWVSPGCLCCVLAVPVCFRHFLSPRARYSVTLKVSTNFFTVDDCVFKHFCFSSLRVLVLCTKIMNYPILSIFCPHS